MRGGSTNPFTLCKVYLVSAPHYKYTSLMIHHRRASLSEQHNDLFCTKRDLSHTSRYVDESSPDSQVSHMYARTAILIVTTYVETKLYTKVMT